MAEKANTEAVTVKKIKCKGPVDKNGAIILRLREGFDILPEQILEVGKSKGNITKEEAEQLLQVSSWKFEVIE